MQHKVAELEGAMLDAAVAKAEGWEFNFEEDGSCWANEEGGGMVTFRPSYWWEQGGPIIERDRIELLYYGADGVGGNPWEAQLGVDTHYIDQYPGDAMGGPTPLIAAMLAKVASKFGDTVELP